MTDQEPAFTPEEVANQLGMSPEIVFQHIKKGRLRARKLRRPKGFKHLPEIATYRSTQEEIDHFKAQQEWRKNHDPVYTMKDVAEILNISVSRVQTHIREGRLQAYKFRSITINKRRPKPTHRISKAQLDGLKRLLAASEGCSRYGKPDLTEQIKQKEKERELHKQAIAQVLNGMLIHEKRKPLKHD